MIVGECVDISSLPFPIVDYILMWEISNWQSIAMNVTPILGGFEDGLKIKNGKGGYNMICKYKGT
jgi:hypothetical protein